MYKKKVGLSFIVCIQMNKEQLERDYEKSLSSLKFFDKRLKETTKKLKEEKIKFKRLSEKYSRSLLLVEDLQEMWLSNGN